MSRKKRNPIPPADALLCERCGYDLAGLTREMACSECGLPVERSLPVYEDLSELRIPDQARLVWQKWWSLVRHPVLTWESVQVQPTRWCHGFIETLVLISLVPGLVYALLVSTMSHSVVAGNGMFFTMIPTMIALLLLLKIEEFGLRFFGARRGWRVSRAVAWTVVQHACFAWTPSAVAVGVVWGLFSTGFLHQATLFGPLSTYLLAIFLAILPGMLWFETLVWIGVRRLRFANIPGSERHLANGPDDAVYVLDG